MDTCRNSSTRPRTRTNRKGGKQGGGKFQETRADQPNVGASAPKQQHRHIRTHQGRNETDKDLQKRATGTHRRNTSPGSTAPTHRADRTHAKQNRPGTKRVATRKHPSANRKSTCSTPKTSWAKKHRWDPSGSPPMQETRSSTKGWCWA